MEQVTTLFPRRFPHWRWRILWHCSARAGLLCWSVTPYAIGCAAASGCASALRRKWALYSAGGDWVRATTSDAAALYHHRTIGCRLPAMGGPSTVEKPRRAAGVAVRRIGMSVTGKTTITGARFIAVESEKCSVLSGANDRLLGPNVTVTAGHMWNLDDKRSVTLGSAADNAYRPAAKSTSLG